MQTVMRGEAESVPGARVPVLWGFAALAAGGVAGWADLAATEVQGPLLLLMTAAFALAFPGRAPAWLIGASAALALPLVRLIAYLAGAVTEGPSWGMALALVPAVGAAYAGRAIGGWVGAAAAAIPRGTGPAADLPPATSANDLHGDSAAVPWFARSAASRTLLAATIFGAGALGAGPLYATLAARGQPAAWWVATWWQVVTCMAWVATAPALFRFARGPRRSSASARAFAEHVVAAVGIVVAHALGLVLLTRLLHVPLGAASAGDAVRWAFAAYLAPDMLTYVLLVSLAHASDGERLARAAREREAALSAALTGSRLVALRAQLRPHFLFNALNSVSVLARKGDGGAAAEMVATLGELLRYVLDDRPRLVRLGEEIAFVEQYLAVERIRFADRLRVRIDASPEAREARVPPLILQPLVENAVRHGVGGRVGAGTVTVRAWREGERLHLIVEDDGPGIAEAADTSEAPGVGIPNTRARLDALYGVSGTLALDGRDGGGTVAHVTLPWSTADVAASGSP